MGQKRFTIHQFEKKNLPLFNSKFRNYNSHENQAEFMGIKENIMVSSQKYSLPIFIQNSVLELEIALKNLTI